MKMPIVLFVVLLGFSFMNLSTYASAVHDHSCEESETVRTPFYKLQIEEIEDLRADEVLAYHSELDYHDLLTVLRTVKEYFAHYPLELEQEGLFRLSANSSEVNRNLLLFAKQVFPRDVNAISAIANAKKVFLLNNVKWLSPIDEKLIRLKDSLTQYADRQDSSSLNCASSSFIQLINELVATQRKSNVEIAEIIYTYFELAAMVEAHSEVNKMTVENIGIVVAMAFQGIIFGIDENRASASSTASFTSVLSEVLSKVVSHPHFTRPFNFHYYSDKKAALKRAKADCKSFKEELTREIRRLHHSISELREMIAFNEKAIENMNAQLKGLKSSSVSNKSHKKAEIRQMIEEIKAKTIVDKEKLTLLEEIILRRFQVNEVHSLARDALNRSSMILKSEQEDSSAR